MQFLILLHETAVKHVLKNWKFRHSQILHHIESVYNSLPTSAHHYHWLHKTNPPFVDFYTLIETRLIWATVLKRRSKIHRERKLYFYRLSEFCERRIGEALQKTGSSLKHSESHKIKKETNLKFYFSFRFCHIFFSTLPKNLAFLHGECYRMRLRYFAPVLAMATMETKWKLGRTIFTWKALARKNKSTQYGNL